MPPTRPPTLRPRQIVELGLFGLLFVAAGVAVIVLLVEYDTTLTCTRDAAGQGECIVATARLVRSTTRRFPVGDLRGAREDRIARGSSSADRDTYGLVVQTAGGSLSLRPRPDDQRSTRRLAAEVNTFVRDPGPATLRVKTSPDRWVFGVGVALAGVGAAVLTVAAGYPIAALRGRGSKSDETREGRR